MMQQRPSISEYDQPAEKAAGKGLHIGVSAGAGGRRDQPPRQQQRAEIQRHAGGTVDDGQRHRQGPAIGLQMRRKRSFDPGGHRRLLTVCGAANGPWGSRVMNSIYVVETASATAKCRQIELAFITRSMTKQS